MMGGTLIHLEDGGFVHLSHADVFNQVIEVNGREWRFDFDRRFGPLWLRKDGEPRVCQNPKSEVWDGFQEWFEKYNAEACQTEKGGLGE